MSIQRNIITTNRLNYAFGGYNTKQVWGEDPNKDKMPVMTYSGFGSELLKNGGDFHWVADFDYIVCDEMQNLVNYSNYENKKEDKKSANKKEDNGYENKKKDMRSVNLLVAEAALRMIAAEGITKIVAMSATPQKIRKRFKELCYDVPYDRSAVRRLKTIETIPYSTDIEVLFAEECLHLKTGIIYTTEIEDMKRIITFAHNLGIRADGFWSIHAEKKMEQHQLDLRDTVLKEETIPAGTDLLVINASSQTCIKIDGKKRPIDYIVVHNQDEEVITQVRGRYHGDLPTLYYHSIDDTNRYKCTRIPDNFMNTRLYEKEQQALCAYLRLRNPKASNKEYFKMRKVREYLQSCGYEVDYKKDSKNGGKHYYRIRRIPV
ncbi:MAG: hypothetical protein IKH57_08285 [Clostridia bacterium]|nr:hypothetical protein [Clostridia bacterium]